MGIQDNGCGSLSQELLGELGAGVLGEEQRGAGGPEVVEAQVLPYAGAGLDALEGTGTQVLGVEQGAGLAEELKVLVLPQPGQSHPLF